VKPLLEQLFGSFKSPAPYTRVPQPFYSTKAAPMTFETPDKANAAMFGRLSMQLTDQSPDYASLLVANRVLGGDTDSRIFQRVRVKGGFSYAVGTAFQPASIDPNSLLVLYAIFAPQNLDNVRSATADEIRRALDGGFKPEEIAAAKKAVLEDRQITRAQDPAVANALVSQAFLGRTWAESEKIDREIEAVTPESATAALRKYVIPADIAFAYAGDFAKK